MNGVLFEILFVRSRSAYYRSLVTNLSAIERHLSKATDTNQENPLHAETILIETFHHASIAAYQAKEEIINTFNTYLIATGILISGMTAILTLVLPEHGNNEKMLEGLAALLLLIGGLISYNFLDRFFQLAEEHFNHIISMDKIRTFYSHHPSLQKIDFKKAFYDPGKRKFNGPPNLIGNTLIVFSSFYCGGFIFIIAYVITTALQISYALFIDIVLIEIAISVLIVIIIGFFYKKYYMRKLKVLFQKYDYLMNES